MKRKHRIGVWLLAALGLVLISAGLFFTVETKPLLEYVLPAVQSESEIAALVKKKDESLQSMAGSLEASCVAATMSGVAVSAPDAGTSAQAALFAGGEGFFEVYPRYLRSGRLLSETELKNGACRAVLDEDLAFKLFPTIDPVGQKISINGIELEVVGTVRHSRRVGEAELYTVYAPLLAVKNAPFEIMTLSAKPLSGSGASVMFESTASDNWRSGGEMLQTQKEVQRALLPIRYVLCIFAVAVLVRLLGVVNGFSHRAIDDIRQRLKQDYIKKLLPRIAVYALGLLACYGILVLFAYFVAERAAAPLYIFTEWVPDSIVEWSSIRAVFWNLAIDAVRPVRAATGTIRAIQFWAGVIRWGVLFCLCSCVLLLLPKKTGQ